MSYYIKGNEKRGAEVIALLQSKDGRNLHDWYGNIPEIYYYISKNNIICAAISPENKHTVENLCTELTLPELEWEPKRGDRVLVKYEQKSLWKEAVFSFKDGDNYYVVGGNVYLHCILFDINKLGKITED